VTAVPWNCSDGCASLRGRCWATRFRYQARTLGMEGNRPRLLSGGGRRKPSQLAPREPAWIHRQVPCLVCYGPTQVMGDELLMIFGNVCVDSELWVCFAS